MKMEKKNQDSTMKKIIGYKTFESFRKRNVIC